MQKVSIIILGHFVLQSIQFKTFKKLNYYTKQNEFKF